MAILAVGAHLVTRNLPEAEETSRWQNLPEVLVVGLRDQIREVSRAEPGRYLPCIGTLHKLPASAPESITGELLDVVAGFEALSTREDTGTDAEGGASLG